MDELTSVLQSMMDRAMLDIWRHLSALRWGSLSLPGRLSVRCFVHRPRAIGLRNVPVRLERLLGKHEAIDLLLRGCLWRKLVIVGALMSD